MSIQRSGRNVSTVLFSLALIFSPMWSLQAQDTAAKQAEQATKDAAKQAGNAASAAADSANSGKFMTEEDAVKAGYHAAKNEKKP